MTIPTQTRDRAVIDAAEKLLKRVAHAPEESLDPAYLDETLADLAPDQRLALLLRLSAAHREAARVYQIAVTQQNAPSAMVWGVSMALLAEIIEGITRTIPDLEDTVASRSACEWLAAEAKRYLMLKANAKLILPAGLEN